MAAITRTIMLAERRCGLKYYDKAVANAGQQAIVDKAIEYTLKFPFIGREPGGNKWGTFSWAFANAVKEFVPTTKDISQTYNLMDVLTDQDIAYIQSKVPGMVGNPPDNWKRKP